MKRNMHQRLSFLQTIQQRSFVKAFVLTQRLKDHRLAIGRKKSEISKKIFNKSSYPRYCQSNSGKLMLIGTQTFIMEMCHDLTPPAHRVTLLFFFVQG
jgi:hypothetical protein